MEIQTFLVVVRRTHCEGVICMIYARLIVPWRDVEDDKILSRIVLIDCLMS